MNANILIILFIFVTVNAQVHPRIGMLNQIFSKIGPTGTVTQSVSDSKPEEFKQRQRIVGGVSSKISDAPYTLSIEIKHKHLCGASIIHMKWALSAAHCFPEFLPIKILFIRSGTSEVSTAGELHRIVKCIKHEDYSSESLQSINDIALISVQPKFSYIKNVQEPIPLPKSNTEFAPGTMAFIFGWGKLFENDDEGSKFLQKARVPIISRHECEASIPGLCSGQICAGYLHGGVDACQGDSGGPLVVDGKLAGIVSYGFGCARPNTPGVYTNVAHYKNWILRKIRLVK